MYKYIENLELLCLFSKDVQKKNTLHKHFGHVSQKSNDKNKFKTESKIQ